MNVDRSSSAPPEGRVARNRHRRSRQFLSAAQIIVTHEGFESLTMSRLADELDSAVSSVYRYFPSKGHLVRAIQAEAIERLTDSYDASVDELVDTIAGRVDAPPSLVRLVVMGRWFVGASEVFPEDVRLLQMITSQRETMLDPEGGDALFPPVMSLLGRVVVAIEQASSDGTIRPSPALARTVMWATALGGTLQADDFERYIPDVVGGGRLARQLNIDLLVGWGADLDVVVKIDKAIDRVAAKRPLARAEGLG